LLSRRHVEACPQLNGIRWQYDVHGRTVEKDNGQTRWHYRYDGEHRLTEVISQPRDRNKPQVQVSGVGGSVGVETFL